MILITDDQMNVTYRSPCIEAGAPLQLLTHSLGSGSAIVNLIDCVPSDLADAPFKLVAFMLKTRKAEHPVS